MSGYPTMVPDSVEIPQVLFEGQLHPGSQEGGLLRALCDSNELQQWLDNVALTDESTRKIQILCQTREALDRRAVEMLARHLDRQYVPCNKLIILNDYSWIGSM